MLCQYTFELSKCLKIIISQDHYVALENVGVRGEAKLILKAWPLVQRSSLKWETPKTFQEPITTTSNEAGYQLTARKVSETELEVHLVVESMTKEDFGRHTLTVENQLGEETYKVSGSFHSLLIIFLLNLGLLLRG